VAKLTGRYTETKHLKSVFNYPSNTVTEYKTISKVDAIAEYIVVGGLGVGVKFMKNNSIAFITRRLYVGFTTHYTLKSIGVISGFPPRVVGQYYKVETWYSSSGLHVKTTIWNTKVAFDSKHQPIYSGTQTSTW